MFCFVLQIFCKEKWFSTDSSTLPFSLSRTFCKQKTNTSIAPTITEPKQTYKLKPHKATKPAKCLLRISIYVMDAILLQRHHLQMARPPHLRCPHTLTTHFSHVFPSELPGSLCAGHRLGSLGRHSAGMLHCLSSGLLCLHSVAGRAVYIELGVFHSFDPFACPTIYCPRPRLLRGGSVDTIRNDKGD